MSSQTQTVHDHDPATTTTTTPEFKKPNPQPVTRIIVLGAGVEGLTTALKIKQRWPGDEVQVDIIAEVLPADPKTVRYTSHWAGAHYVSSAPPGTREADIAQATFREMWDLSAPGTASEECFLRLPQTELYAQEPQGLTAGEGDANPFENMPEYHKLTATELSQLPGASTKSGKSESESESVKAVCGFSFHTVTIDVPVYLRYLTERVLEKGVKFIRGHVQHIDQVLEGGSGVFQSDFDNRNITEVGAGTDRTVDHPDQVVPDAVVVCVGLGARTLGGVDDTAVYPSRGQTVILRAPWVRFGRTFEDEINKKWTYIIPRRGGDVVVGGIQGVNDWYPKIRPETTRDLLERGLKLCPELVPPETRTKRAGVIDDLIPLIVDQGCGLRPMRKGGPRIELEYVRVPRPGPGGHQEVPVVHNYGHGERGYIQSIGSAKLVVQLLEKALAMRHT